MGVIWFCGAQPRWEGALRVGVVPLGVGCAPSGARGAWAASRSVGASTPWARCPGTPPKGGWWHPSSALKHPGPLPHPTLTPHPPTPTLPLPGCSRWLGWPRPCGALPCTGPRVSLPARPPAGRPAGRHHPWLLACLPACRHHPCRTGPLHHCHPLGPLRDLAALCPGRCWEVLPCRAGGCCWWWCTSPWWVQVVGALQPDGCRWWAFFVLVGVLGAGALVPVGLDGCWRVLWPPHHHPDCPPPTPSPPRPLPPYTQVNSNGCLWWWLAEIEGLENSWVEGP